MKKKLLFLLLAVVLCVTTGCTCNVADGNVYYGCYGALLPCYNNYYNIGSPTGHWNTLYVNNIVGWTPPAGAGTGNVTAIPGGSTGYVPYFSSSTNLVNSGCFWDVVGSKLGINDITPSTALDVTGAIHATGDISNDSDINSGNDLNCINDLDVGDNIIVHGNVGSNLTATANSTYDLGSATILWEDIYVENLHAGTVGGLSPIKIISNMDMNSYQIKNIGDPTDAYDVVSKNYGDTHYLGSGSGDMTKAIYDTDYDNRVDIAEGINDGTYSSTAQQISNTVSLAHSNANDPTTDQKAALAGTNGSPSITNKYVTDTDTRNTDARIPTTHTHSESDVTSLTTDLGNRELTANKGAINGYAGLDASQKISTANLGTGTANATTYLRGDQTWTVISSSSGDMTKAVYDIDTDNIVDKAENVDDGIGNSSNATQVKSAVTNSHTHSNITVLNNIEESLTTTLKSSYDWLVTNITSAWKTSIDNHTTNMTNPHSTTATQVGLGNVPNTDATNATNISSGILDGDRLPAMSTTKKGSVPATGTPSGKYLKDDSTWEIPTAGAHDLGGTSHNADTLANLNAKISDADVVALAGQIGGTAASPDIRGLRESGGQLLAMGAVTDGQYLLRSGTTITSSSPGGGSSPSWYGYIYGAYGSCDPGDMLRMMQKDVNVAATPTAITATVARCSFFRPPANITVDRIRFYGVGATTGIYRVALYSYNIGASTGTQLVEVNDFNTAANAWGVAGSNLNISLTAGTLYFIAVSVDTTGTTPGIACWGDTTAATTGTIQTAPQSLPGNLDADVGYINGYNFQFTIVGGDLPATTGTLAAQTAIWTGGIPAFFLDANDAL